MDGKIIIKSPKSRRSWRTLPLFEPVTSALETLYKAQAAEKEAAGPAYAGDVDSGCVVADELGEPLHPERYSDEFGRLCREAGLLRIRLHDTRGTMNGILEQAGVPGLSARRVARSHSRHQPEELPAAAQGSDGRE